MAELVLLIGGAASGKSARAEALARADGADVCYLATHRPGDDAEMAGRLARHRERRPASWSTVESPELGEAALAAIPDGAAVLLDSLTAHLADRLFADEAALLAAYADAGPEALAPWLDGCERLLTHAARWRICWVVSDEVGLGVVPERRLGRAFRDLLGAGNQRLAAVADRALLVVAGRALELAP